MLYRNRGDGRFEDATAIAGVGDSERGFGAVFGDTDGDGDPDLYVANSRKNVLYRNDGSRGHWLKVRTRGTMSNRDGIGARVKVIYGPRSQIREVTA